MLSAFEPCPPQTDDDPEIILDLEDDLELVADGNGFWVARPDGSAPRPAPVGRRVPRVGEVVGPYEILAEIGRGGLGIVWRARDTRTGDELAVKTVLETADESDLELLQREASLAGRVHHPGVVAVRPPEVHDGVFMVPMELLCGESLDERLARCGRLPAHEVAAIVGRLASAVAALHEAGVVHCDLSPANVLLVDPHEAPRLIDFGAAARIGETPEWILGTPAYMSPEQTTGGELTPLTDVYALGALLYRLLCGQAPHDGATIREMFDMITHAPIEMPASAAARRGLPEPPFALALIMMRCLSKQPSRRPASAGEVAEALARFLEGVVISDDVLSEASRAVRRRDRVAGRHLQPAVAGPIAAVAAG